MRDYGSLRLRAEIGIGEKPYGSEEGGGLQEVIGLSLFQHFGVRSHCFKFLSENTKGFCKVYNLNFVPLFVT